MPMIHILDAEVSSDELVRAVDQLGTTELDRFVSRVLMLQARRRAPALPAEEAALVARINRGLPAELRDRLDQLGDKRANETLTDEEHAELLGLVPKLEALEVERLEDLSQLARMRGVSLTDLMDQLGIRPPTHD
jgi:phosphoglycerate-specific signal transduction histidine kinase